jgi:putative transposase
LRRRGAAKKGGLDAQGLGRSKGGLTTKLHAVTDGLGNPVRLMAGPGQENDMARAYALIAGLVFAALIADRAYDADPLIEAAQAIGAVAVIPPRKHRKHRRDYDEDLYKERNLIERFFNKLKQFRRVATRYDKLLRNFLGFVKIAAIAIWLK